MPRNGINGATALGCQVLGGGGPQPWEEENSWGHLQALGSLPGALYTLLCKEVAPEQSALVPPSSEDRDQGEELLVEGVWAAARCTENDPQGLQSDPQRFNRS